MNKWHKCCCLCSALIFCGCTSSWCDYRFHWPCIWPLCLILIDFRPLTSGHMSLQMTRLGVWVIWATCSIRYEMAKALRESNPLNNSISCKKGLSKWCKYTVKICSGVCFTGKYYFSLSASKYHIRDSVLLPFLCHYLWNSPAISEWK